MYLELVIKKLSEHTIETSDLTKHREEQKYKQNKDIWRPGLAHNETRRTAPLIQ